MRKLPPKMRALAKREGLETPGECQTWLLDCLRERGIDGAAAIAGVSRATASLWALKLGIEVRWVITRRL